MSDAAVRWAGLLVSVRDAAEATEAVAGGAAIIDVKEPLAGALGAAPAATAAAVATTVAGRVPWTLACGELGAGAAAMVASAAVAALPCGIAPPAAAKAGAAGLAIAAWSRAFADFATSLPRGVEPVAVAYADWWAAAAPDPRELVAAANAVGCRTLLVDTFDKNGRCVLDAAAADLPAWIGAARAAGMTVALAGRLSRADVPRAAGLGADVCAVRTAACRGGRLGRVDRALVAATAAAWALAGSRTGRHSDLGTVRAPTATLEATAGVGPTSSPGAPRSMKPIEVRVPHGLDEVEVRRRIDRALDKARNDYAGQVGDIDAAWRDDGRLDVAFTVMGMAIGSEVEMVPGEVVVRVTLPALAGMFAGQIRTGISERIGGLLGTSAA